MADQGYTHGWGVGRHVIGSNYFRYVRDPWGSFAEYSFDIDFIPADVEWTASDHPLEDSFYVWGPETPDDFIVNHESAAPGAVTTLDARQGALQGSDLPTTQGGINHERRSTSRYGALPASRLHSR